MERAKRVASSKLRCRDDEMSGIGYCTAKIVGEKAGVVESVTRSYPELVLAADRGRRSGISNGCKG